MTPFVHLLLLHALISSGLGVHVRSHVAGGRLAPRARVRSAEPAGSPSSGAANAAERLLVQVADPLIWAAEKLELADMAAAPETPDGLRGYLGSYESNAVFPSNRQTCFHSFEKFGQPLEEFTGWPSKSTDPRQADEERIGLIRDLLGAISHLHSRGIPHLCVNERSVRIGRLTPDGPLRLRIVGAGAGPSLNAANRTFQVPRSWAYTPPEVLSGLIVQSNLPALFAMDAWSVGTVLAMIVSGSSASPQAARAEWYRLQFNERAAVLARIAERTEHMNDFLIELDAASSGFLFRNALLVELLITMLKVEPRERTPVNLAFQKVVAFAPPPTPPAAAAAAVPLPGRLEQPSGPGGAEAEESAASAAAAAAGQDSMLDAAASLKSLTLQERIAIAFPRGSAAALGGAGAGAAAAAAAAAAQAAAVGRQGRAEAGAAGLGVGGGAGEAAPAEPFRSLEAIISIVEGGRARSLVQEASSRRYSRAFAPQTPAAEALASGPGPGPGPYQGYQNVYLDVLGFRNRAKGARWEAIALACAPVGEAPPPGSEVRLSGLVGVALVKGGCHVLVVQVAGTQPEPREQAQNLRLLLDSLGSDDGRCKYLELESLDFGDRTTLRDIWSYSTRQ